MRKKILIVDSTLRDGSHAIHHQFTKKMISTYAKGAEEANLPLLIVGHGNGLGASSLQLGLSNLTDSEMLLTANKMLKSTRLGAFLIPGFGTIENDLQPAIDVGIKSLMVASHCSEANITKEHIEYAANKQIDVYGILMMSHMLPANELLKQAKLMQEYGAKGVILMDSAGTYLPQDTTEKISKLVQGLKVKVGFHAHNNLGLAIANSIAAVQAGATMIDATSGGLGAGAGNCQLEVFVAVMEKIGYNTNLDLYKLMDNSEYIATIREKPQEISTIELASGLAGVFSGFAPHVKRHAKSFNVDVRKIFVELGKRKIVAGQEDIIIDVANELAQENKK
jgi:4-hydroxy 2-oxovalerate aldolase